MVEFGRPRAGVLRRWGGNPRPERKRSGGAFFGALANRPQAVWAREAGLGAAFGNRGAAASVGAERACRGQAGAARFDACQIRQGGRSAVVFCVRGSGTGQTGIGLRVDLGTKKGCGVKYATGAGLIVLAGVLWSVQGLIIRNIHEAGSWAILFWRSAGMIPVLLAWIAVKSGGRVVGEVRSVGVPGVIGGLGLVLAFSGAIYAFQTTSVANAVLLFSASPFFAAILGRALLGEAVSVVTWTAIGLAAFGIAVMVGGGIAGGAMDGNVAALLSALGFAIFTVMLRWGKVANMMPAVVLGGVFSMIAAALALAALGQVLLVPAREIAIAVAMGAVTLCGGMLLYTAGSRVVPAAQSTLLSLVEVLLAPVWVWLFLGETVTQGTLIGGAVLLAAVVMNAYGGRVSRMAVQGG